MRRMRDAVVLHFFLPHSSSSSCGRGSPHNLHFHTCVYPTVARQRVYLSVPPYRTPHTPLQLYYYFHKLYKNNNRIALRTDRAKPGEQSDTESELSSMARVIHYAGGHLFAKQFSEALLGPLGDRLLGQTQPLHQRVQFWPVRI